MEFEVAVHRYHHLEGSLGAPEKLSVLDTLPTLTAYRRDLMAN